MNSFAQKSTYCRQGGFTLVEMLVAVSILALIMVMSAQMIAATSKIWKNTTSKIESFQSARDGFQLMTDELRQATTNTYWDYFDNTGLSARFSAMSPFIPSAYGRMSDLHFRSGKSVIGASQVANTMAVFFQAPLGYVANPGTYGSLQNLLNGTGFYIQAADGTGVLNANPPFLSTTTPPYRYRLMQFIQPTEQNTVFNYTLTPGTSPTSWFLGAITSSRASTVRIVASNVIDLIVLPKATDVTTDTTLTGSASYSYDSRIGLNSGVAATTAAAPNKWITPGTSTQPAQMNQMPPIVRIAMVAIDEQSAKLLTTGTTPTTLGLSASITAALAQRNTGTDNSVLFTNPLYMDSDLLYLQYGPAGLVKIKPHLNFRVFSTTVVVKSARFSTQ